jgi:hypothetical protein
MTKLADTRDVAAQPIIQESPMPPLRTQPGDRTERGETRDHPC